VSNENLFRLQKAEADYQSALLALRQITNVDEPIVPSESELPTIQQPLPTDDFAFSQTALGGIFSARATASERNLSLAKQGFLPGLTIGFTEQMLIKGFNPYNIDRTRFEKGNFMGFEVGISIPLFWGGQNAKLKAARRDIELAEIARRQAEQKMNMAYRNALTEIQRAQKVLDYYTRKGNAQGEKMARLSQISYENGEIGYVEYIQNLQTALDVQLRFADAVNDYNQAVINLNFIKGEEK
jgi:cobalt-zinc-cadmium resistance protein CzcA